MGVVICKMNKKEIIIMTYTVPVVLLTSREYSQVYSVSVLNN